MYQGWTRQTNEWKKTLKSRQNNQRYTHSTITMQVLYLPLVSVSAYGHAYMVCVGHVLLVFYSSSDFYSLSFLSSRRFMLSSCLAMCLCTRFHLLPEGASQLTITEEADMWMYQRIYRSHFIELFFQVMFISSLGLLT